MLFHRALSSSSLFIRQLKFYFFFQISPIRKRLKHCINGSIRWSLQRAPPHDERSEVEPQLVPQSHHAEWKRKRAVRLRHKESFGSSKRFCQGSWNRKLRQHGTVFTCTEIEKHRTGKTDQRLRSIENLERGPVDDLAASCRRLSCQ